MDELEIRRICAAVLRWHIGRIGCAKRSNLIILSAEPPFSEQEQATVEEELKAKAARFGTEPGIVRFL